MNSQSTNELRARLEQHKSELVERVSKIKADIGRGLDADSKEQATQLQNREVLDALSVEGLTELAEINAALQRLDDGTYGVCASCGEAIDVRRLNVRPLAIRCIACASASAS